MLIIELGKNMNSLKILLSDTWDCAFVYGAQL